MDELIPTFIKYLGIVLLFSYWPHSLQNMFCMVVCFETNCINSTIPPREHSQRTPSFSQDPTGDSTWPPAVVLMAHFATSRARAMLHGKAVLELGAGNGTSK